MVTKETMLKCRQASVQALLDTLFELPEIKEVHLGVLCQLPDGSMIRGVDVPVDFIKQGCIQLNISPKAINGFHYNEETHQYIIEMTFNAKRHTVTVPVNTILQVLGFGTTGEPHDLVSEQYDVFIPLEEDQLQPKKQKPNLKLVH